MTETNISLGLVPKKGTDLEKRQALLQQAREQNKLLQEGKLNPAEMSPEALLRFTKLQFVLSQDMEQQLAEQREFSQKRKREEEVEHEKGKKRVKADLIALNKYLEHSPVEEESVDELANSLHPKALGSLHKILEGVRAYTDQKVDQLEFQTRQNDQLSSVIRKEVNDDWSEVCRLSQRATNAGRFADPNERYENVRSVGVPSWGVGIDENNDNRRTKLIPLDYPPAQSSVPSVHSRQPSSLPSPDPTSSSQSLPSNNQTFPSHLQITLPEKKSKVNSLMEKVPDFRDAHVNAQKDGTNGGFLNDVFEVALGGVSKGRGSIFTSVI